MNADDDEPKLSTTQDGLVCFVGTIYKMDGGVENSSAYLTVLREQ